jgi:hypothetical protein
MSQTKKVFTEAELEQERKEILSYIKLHLDVIAVILVITYTGYLLYKANKGAK